MSKSVKMKKTAVATVAALSAAASLGAAQAGDLRHAVQANPHAVSIDQYGRPAVVNFNAPTVKEGETSSLDWLERSVGFGCGSHCLSQLP